MPTPPRRSGDLSGASLSRRAALGLLAGAVGAAAAGCTVEQAGSGARRRRRVEPKVDPDVAAAAESLEEQEAVLALVEATRQRHRTLAGVLAPVAATHEAHVAVLRKAVPGGTRSPSPPAGSGGRGPSVPRTPAQALQQVVRAEQDLRTSTKQHAAAARSGPFARVLGSMAAAAAQQAAVLASSADGKERP